MYAVVAPPLVFYCIINIIILSSFLDFDCQFFWKWTDFQSYLDFMLLFAVAGSAMTFLLLESILYVEIIGFLAVFIEAMLGMPQLLQNHKNKSTQGMR